jgi:hypothetical protein
VYRGLYSSAFLIRLHYLSIIYIYIYIFFFLNLQFHVNELPMVNNLKFYKKKKERFHSLNKIRKKSKEKEEIGSGGVKLWGWLVSSRRTRHASLPFRFPPFADSGFAASGFHGRRSGSG